MSQDNFCIECCHLLGKRQNVEGAADGSWKCYHPDNISSKSVDFVTGRTVYKLHIESIYQARALGSPCGEAGKQFAQYATPVYNAVNVTVRGKTVRVNLDDI
mgnify:CR=1 FL=1